MKHFVLCQHGLLGNQSDFQNLAEHFHSLPGNPVEVLILKSSSGVTQTLDGVAQGGSRCMSEIMNLLKTGLIPKHSKLSLVGHSLGGLYLRYALREIEKNHSGLWDEFCVKRNLCIFLATPHLGIECSSWVIRNSVNFLFRHVSKTAEDLSLQSTVLTDLADELGINSLNAFNRIILYGNVCGDNLVSIVSSLIIRQGSFVPETAISTQTIIKEVDLSKESQVSTESTDARKILLGKLSLGLKNVSRYSVQFPPGLPGNLSVVDNTAHHRIICHGILDRGKAGLPVLKHIEDLIIN